MLFVGRRGSADRTISIFKVQFLKILLNELVYICVSLSIVILYFEVVDKSHCLIMIKSKTTNVLRVLVMWADYVDALYSYGRY